MGRKSIDINTLRYLYGKSGNKCAFPDCNEPIFEDDGTLTGECCHIEAFSAGGARYNPNTTIEQRNSKENLIMLCARHHKIIDSHPQEYPTERLREIKTTHEQQFSRETRELNDKMLYALRHSTKEFWSEIQRIDEEAFANEFKIKANPSCNIEDLLNEIEETFSNIENSIISLKESDGQLLDDFHQLCAIANVNSSQFDDALLHGVFIGRNWIYHELAFPNNINYLKMYYLELCVRIFEEFAKMNHSLSHKLEEYKQRLAEHQKRNYCID